MSGAALNLAHGDHDRCTIAPESVILLDGGAQAYPRMLSAIDGAQRSVHLEVYTFAPSGVGACSVAALAHAGHRGVTGPAGAEERNHMNHPSARGKP